MNKKLLLLGSALALTAVSHVDAKSVTGFYVGAKGSVNLAQFKIHDASSHTAGSTTMTVPVPSGDPLSTHFAEVDSSKGLGERDYMLGTIGNDTSGPGVATVNTRSIVAGSEDFIAEETIYKVRPSAQIFVGYNYQIGSNFVVGLELKAGMIFGDHKYAGMVKLPSLTHYNMATAPNAAITTEEPFADKSVQTSFEFETKFDGDASLRLGFIVPGTDGRLAFFLHGGGGLMNRELKVHQATLDPYILAASASAHADIKAQMQAIHNKYVGKLGALSPESATFYALQNMKFASDLMCGYTGFVKGYGAADVKIPYPFTAVANKGFTPADMDANCKTATADAAVNQIICMGKTYDVLYYDNTVSPASFSKSDTNWTWHVGADMEYHFASGLFVRASYTFKYAKGFFAENPVRLSTYDKTTCLSLIDQMDKDSIWNGYLFDGKVKGAKTDNTPAVIGSIATAFGGTGNDEHGLDNARAAVVAAMKRKLDALPAEGLDLGTINRKIGHGDKLYHHEFSLGIGYKF